jgi:hypothetical protein
MARRTLTKVSTEDLKTELRRRIGRLETLQRKRRRLAEQLAEVDAEIESLGGELNGVAGRRSGKRPRNEMNLVDALAKVLKNKTMGVTEAAEAVQNAGYRTTSSSFRTIVNQTLINSDKFKRVARGQYTAK